MLDRANYYATTGGHGACRGCGEVTAIRLVTSTNHAIHDKRRKDHTRELESLIDQLTAKRDAVPPTPARAASGSTRTLKTLEKRLYLYESGPTGNGPSGMVIANATGCSSVYASTFPFNPYTDPWVNSLFQDTPAVAKGIFEGLTAQAADDFRALRIAKLELADAYDPAQHDGLLPLLRLGLVHAGGTQPAADRAQHGRRRRHLRHRLRRAVAAAVDQDPDQGRGAEHRRLFQHRRPDLDRQPHRPGLRPVAVRRRQCTASRNPARSSA